MKIVLANDHSAVDMKKEILAHLEEKGYQVIDIGTNSPESCDYPVFGERAGKMVASGKRIWGF